VPRQRREARSDLRRQVLVEPAAHEHGVRERFGKPKAAVVAAAKAHGCEQLELGFEVARQLKLPVEAQLLVGVNLTRFLDRGPRLACYGLAQRGGAQRPAQMLDPH
jgi:hypothetical protein